MTSPNHASGRLVIKDEAIEKTAAYVASKLPGFSAATRLSLRGAGGPLRLRPKVDVQLDAGVASITVHLAAPYPAPLRTLTEQARWRVSTEVTRLTGVPIRWVDIELDQLQHTSMLRVLR